MPSRLELLGRAVLARLSRLCLWVSVALLALMAGLVAAQVVARNGFDLGLPWAEELARFCGVALVFLTVPLLALRRDMVAVTMVPDMMGPRGRKVLDLVSALSIIAFAGLMLWGFAAFLPRAGKFSTPAMGMSNYAFYAPALVGTVLLGLAAILRAVETLRGTPPLDSDAEGAA